MMGIRLTMMAVVTLVRLLQAILAQQLRGLCPSARELNDYIFKSFHFDSIL